MWCGAVRPSRSFAYSFQIIFIFKSYDIIIQSILVIMLLSFGFCSFKRKAGIVGFPLDTFFGVAAALPPEPGGRSAGGGPVLGVAGLASLAAGVGALLLAGAGLVVALLRRRHRARHPGGDKPLGQWDFPQHASA